jgi:hypothetical protein
MGKADCWLGGMDKVVDLLARGGSTGWGEHGLAISSLAVGLTVLFQVL